MEVGGGRLRNNRRRQHKAVQIASTLARLRRLFSSFSNKAVNDLLPEATDRNCGIGRLEFAVVGDVVEEEVPL